MTKESVFQQIPEDEWLFESKYFFVIKDQYPVNPGHLLIISKAKKETYFDLSEEEQKELTQVINSSKQIIENEHSPDGYNIGMNCGESAGQTVFHFHCHVIPRYKGDMDDPRGGVRHCVEGQGYY